MSKKISNSELIALVAEKTGKTKKDVKETLAAFEDVVLDIALSNNAVTVGELGIFKPVVRKARTAKVPGTDKTVEVPAKSALAFKASKPASRFLNGQN